MNNQYKIAIFGSNADPDEVKDELPLVVAELLGKTLASHKVTIITGACSGIPYQMAFQANKFGCDVWGYSPEVDLEHQKLFTPNDDISIYSKLFYMPDTFPLLANPQACKKYRNVISTEACDAGLIISGRWGTMNEFTNLFDMGKVIGVLTGFGGIADELPRLSKKIKKKSKAKIVSNSNPTQLVNLIIEELNKRKK